MTVEKLVNFPLLFTVEVWHLTSSQIKRSTGPIFLQISISFIYPLSLRHTHYYLCLAPVSSPGALASYYPSLLLNCVHGHMPKRYYLILLLIHDIRLITVTPTSYFLSLHTCSSAHYILAHLQLATESQLTTPTRVTYMTLEPLAPSPEKSSSSYTVENIPNRLQFWKRINKSRDIIPWSAIFSQLYIEAAENALVTEDMDKRFSCCQQLDLYDDFLVCNDHRRRKSSRGNF